MIIPIFKKGFTIIELLITLVILAMMAVIIIPAFSKYGARNEFDQKMVEIESAINETYTRSINPEKTVVRYIVEADTTNKVMRFKKDDVEIKNITLPTSYTVTNTSGKPFLVFEKEKKYCCNLAAVNNGTGDPIGCVPADLASGKYITISNSSIGKTKTFNILTTPFRVQMN